VNRARYNGEGATLFHIGGRLLSCQQILGLYKKVTMEKHSRLICFGISDDEKRFIILTPRPSVIKHFASVIYKYS
jgi:hypothetical protein